MSEKLNSENFEEKVIKSEKVTIVDFYANWCGPCKSLSPIIDEISEEYSEKVNVYKVDIDENNEISSKYQIRSIPTILFFKDGEVFDKKIGLVGKDEIVNSIK